MCVCGGGGERQIFKGVLNFLKTREGQIRVASGGVCVPCGGSLSGRRFLRRREGKREITFVSWCLDCQGIIAVLHQ